LCAMISAIFFDCFSVSENHSTGTPSHKYLIVEGRFPMAESLRIN
jgi:hypothetical protein